MHSAAQGGCSPSPPPPFRRHWTRCERGTLISHVVCCADAAADAAAAAQTDGDRISDNAETTVASTMSA